MKAVVGISGGVDSAVATYLLKQKGFEVVGITMLTSKLKEQLNEVEDAKKIANKLDIKLDIVDLTEKFENKIIKYFVEEYKNGKTPNPCALCNRQIKFNLLLEKMKQYNADYISTGHYANIVFENGRYAISKSKNYQKDQSYLLYNLTQEQLKKTIFPLSDLSKNETRELAKQFDIEISKKNDSEDLCFIKNIDYVEFIKQYELGNDYKLKIANGTMSLDKLNNIRGLSKGEFVDKNDNVLGYHNGTISYTIGQRKNINIAFGKRQYVVNVDAKNNKIVLGSNEDLYTNEFEVNNINYQMQKEIDLFDGDEFIVKTRYRDPGTICTINKYSNCIKCSLSENVRALTRGQVAVFYKNDIIYMGGTIV